MTSALQRLDVDAAVDVMMVCYVLLPKLQMLACGEDVRVAEHTQEVPFMYMLYVIDDKDPIVGFTIEETRMLASWVGLHHWDALTERSGEFL